jgi:hypothetical protein
MMPEHLDVFALAAHATVLGRRHVQLVEECCRLPDGSEII